MSGNHELKNAHKMLSCLSRLQYAGKARWLVTPFEDVSVESDDARIPYGDQFILQTKPPVSTTRFLEELTLDHGTSVLYNKHPGYTKEYKEKASEIIVNGLKTVKRTILENNLFTSFGNKNNSKDIDVLRQKLEGKTNKIFPMFQSKYHVCRVVGLNKEPIKDKLTTMNNLNDEDVAFKSDKLIEVANTDKETNIQYELIFYNKCDLLHELAQNQSKGLHQDIFGQLGLILNQNQFLIE